MDETEKDQEIARLKEQVRRLDNIIALMPGHVYWLDRNNVFLGCNDLQAKSAMLPSRESIVGKTNYDMLWKNEADQLNAINNLVMETGQSHTVEEVAYMANGIGTYLSQKVPLRNQSGEIIGLLGISFDITERKEMEKALHQAKEAAEIANRLKTDFMRNMEHDIRTPLCGIMNVASYLKSIENHLQKKELLDDMENASNELLDYLNNILEFSQMSLGTTPGSLKEFNLSQVIKNIISAELPAAKSKQLHLTMECANDLPKILFGDKFRIYRILINLISNAIKFTHQGYVKIIVNVKEKTKENILIEIKIADSGIGIAKENLKLIFNKFMRCDPANKGVYKGTGLGLWIVKEFMEELGGEITVQSELGKGSIFICLLPFQLSPNEETENGK